MKQALAYVWDCLWFLAGDTATITILVAVAGASFFAFVLGRVMTAIIEARLHVKPRDKHDASQ